MGKEYIIPHNYKNNGRIFNMFDKDQVKKTLIVITPITAVLYFLPISFQIKLFFWIIVAGGPACILLFELDQIIWDVMTFPKRKQIYYDGGRTFIYGKGKEKTWHQFFKK